MKKLLRLLGIIVLDLAVIYLVLLIPLDSRPPLETTAGKPFAWNQDALWESLEAKFVAAREADSTILLNQLDSSSDRINTLIDTMSRSAIPSDSYLLGQIESSLFEAAPVVAARHFRASRFLTTYIRMRNEVKRQSITWNLSSPDVRARLYRLLYGGRAAVEEVLLQLEPDSVPALMFCNDEPSATPSCVIQGVTVHSGDILVSRGGAPTSALIARGSDFPGNFSHVAIVYVNDTTGQTSIVEAHIEKGVALATIDDYLRDTKLRIMVLRLRSDLPALVADPTLPHEAASLAYTDARKRHIPYDFAMDYHDPSKLFCSEVASTPYRELGINLWMGISHISAPGVRNWLSEFGVRYFETQEPSDLEYDPQLVVIAEWRDPETLYKDHLDNAVIDVMLEAADSGRALTYNRLMLPFARVLKAYSWVLNLFGKVGPVPEGMPAESALRNKQLSGEHVQIKNRLIELADTFQQQYGYRPPYWELVNLARQARDEVYR